MLLKIRKNVASGPVVDYWENANYIGWVRRGQGPKICVVIISNAKSYVYPDVTLRRFLKGRKLKRRNPYFSTSNELHVIRMFVGRVSCSTYMRTQVDADRILVLSSFSSPSLMLMWTFLFSGLRSSHLQERFFSPFAGGQDLHGRMGKLPVCPRRNRRLDSRIQHHCVFVICGATEQRLHYPHV